MTTALTAWPEPPSIARTRVAARPAALVSAARQGSLLDLGDDVGLAPLSGHVTRTELAHGAWIDHRPSWITASDTVLEHLLHEVTWVAERRRMYDRVVDVPRLIAWYDAGDALPHDVLVDARSALSTYYRPELGEPFVTAGMCLYRDGRDSVAWHGDTVGRSATEDTLVAIVSFGAPRALALRPRGGGPSQSLMLGHGDLVVMGGSCQRTWEHAVPKTARPVGPRVSVQFRPAGVA